MLPVILVLTHSLFHTHEILQPSSRGGKVPASSSSPTVALHLAPPALLHSPRYGESGPMDYNASGPEKTLSQSTAPRGCLPSPSHSPCSLCILSAVAGSKPGHTIREDATPPLRFDHQGPLHPMLVSPPGTAPACSPKDSSMTTAHRPTWAPAQAAASDVGNWSTGGTKRFSGNKLI